MEAVAEAVAPHLAVGAVVGFHPFTVAVDVEFVLPHVPEAVVVYVALMVVAANTEAS